MAKQRQKQRLVVKEDAGRVAAEASGAAASDAADAAQTDRKVRNAVLVVAIVVFVVFEVLVIRLFSSGEQIHWKRELVAIDKLYADGEAAKAAKELEEFGTRWPDARKTFDWNRKMGRYNLDAGNHEKAARHFAQAVLAKPGEPGVRALAGEALWKHGKKEQALEFFKEEIEKIDRSIGDHDRANAYIGQHMLETGQYYFAMQHFHSIADRAAWKAQIDAAAERVTRELVEPARQRALAAAKPAAKPNADESAAE